MLSMDVKERVRRILQAVFTVIGVVAFLSMIWSKEFSVSDLLYSIALGLSIGTTYEYLRNREKPAQIRIIWGLSIAAAVVVLLPALFVVLLARPSAGP